METVPVSEPSQQAASAGAAGDAQAARQSCFVIDDDAGICKALSFTLRRLGFSTSEIATPAALEAALETETPKLVFLDLGLGQAGAMDILPILSEHGYTGPVQLMSGRSQAVLDEVVAVGREFGLTMLPALEKPFRMGVVKELVAGLGFVAPDQAAPAA
jgi:DNA-binding NtrC family response regulator